MANDRQYANRYFRNPAIFTHCVTVLTRYSSCFDLVYHLVWLFRLLVLLLSVVFNNVPAYRTHFISWYEMRYPSVFHSLKQFVQPRCLLLLLLLLKLSQQKVRVRTLSIRRSQTPHNQPNVTHLPQPAHWVLLVLWIEFTTCGCVKNNGRKVQ